jgi:hypothetical protein
MAAFLFKVFTLTIRTVAKPLSKQVEAYVLKHPTLRKPVIDLAQVSSSMHFLLLGVSESAVHPSIALQHGCLVLNMSSYALACRCCTDWTFGSTVARRGSLLRSSWET